MATPKDKLNEILNNLNEAELSEVANFAEFLALKKEKAFWHNLPEDDEPLTAEELEAIKEAKEDFKAGRTLTFEEVFKNND